MLRVCLADGRIVFVLGMIPGRDAKIVENIVSVSSLKKG